MVKSYSRQALWLKYKYTPVCYFATMLSTLLLCLAVYYLATSIVIITHLLYIEYMRLSYIKYYLKESRNVVVGVVVVIIIIKIGVAVW